MRVETHKDYTINMGNKNWIKGGFGLSSEIANDAPPELVEKVKNKQVETIDRWIDEVVQAEKDKYTKKFQGFNE